MASIEEIKSSQFVSLEEITKALQKFSDNDGDNGDKVSYKHLKVIMRDLGLDPREKEVAQCIETLKSFGKGPDRSTHFTAEALHELLNNRRKNDNLEEIRTAFKLFDIKGKGYITGEDLKFLTDEFKEAIKPEELEEMIEIAGNKVPGRVSFEEFAYIMKKTSLY